MSENADKIKMIPESPNTRVEKALNKAMSVYLTRLKMGMIEEGLEVSFQMHLAGLLRDALELLTIDKNERFVVELEKNMGDKNYVDICVEYHKNGHLSECYPIELKFKKKSQSAAPQNVIECFKDIYNLEQLANKQFEGKEIKFCYFIFLTNHKIYTEKPSNEKDIRAKFPMWDGAKIIPNQIYKDDSKTAESVFKKYPKDFKFKHNYDINYQKITTHENKNLWFFKLQIPPK